MSLFERATRKHVDSPPQAREDTPQYRWETSGSSSEAEDSAAHIAELVRRSTERDARPRPSSFATLAPADLTVAQPPAPAAASAPPDPGGDPTDSADSAPVGLPQRRWSTRTQITGVAAVVVLIAGGLAVSRPFSSDAGTPVSTRAAPTATHRPSSAPPDYTVRVADVITDCASHSHGQMRSWFEARSCRTASRSLATGRVSGRLAIFVISRIRMASAASAASLKTVLDADGTGNLNSLLSEGRTFKGAPAQMPSAGYASVQKGAVVMVAEAGFVDGGRSSNTSPALRAAAARVAAITGAQG